MTLKKRYLRNLKKNISFYIGTILLTALVAVLYLGCAASCVTVGENLDAFYEEYHVEDAQFTTLTELPDSEIEELENKYDILLEKQSYIDFEEKNDTIRIMSPSQKVNLYKVSSGKDIFADNEILLNTGFMEENEMKIGDRITVLGKSFLVTGDFERPDYLFTIKETTDTYAITAEFGIAVVSEKNYETLSKQYGQTSSYYSVIYHRDNEDDVRRHIHEEYTMLSYLKAAANTRINTPVNEIAETLTMMDMVVVVFVIFIAVMVAVVIGRKIKNDRRQIGVLIALGYRKKELAGHYAFYGFLPGLMGAVLGWILSLVFAGKIIRLMFTKFEPIPLQYQIGIIDALVAILVPVILYTFAVYHSAKKVMKTDVITMISGRHGTDKKLGFRMKNSRLSVKTKYKLRQILGKPGRTVIVVIGLAFGGMLYAFCATCIDSMDDYVKHTVDRIGDFEYEYFLKTVQSGIPESGSPILGSGFEVKDTEDAIMLLGIEDTKYINFSDAQGRELEYDEEHFYLTSMASMAFGVGTGEDITFVNPITLEEYNVTITDIVKNDSQSAIYCSRQNAGKLLDIPGNYYNIIMSDKKIDIDEDILVKTVSKTSLAEQIEEVKTQMENLVGILNVFAIVICVIVVYMMVDVLVGESASSVSMLKVLGYRNKEINSMMLNVYHILVPIAILISFLLGFLGTKAVFDANVSVYKTYLSTLIYPESVVKLVALVVVSYVISLVLLRRKVNKVNMVESLKDNRE